MAFMMKKIDSMGSGGVGSSSCGIPPSIAPYKNDEERMVLTKTSLSLSCLAVAFVMMGPSCDRTFFDSSYDIRGYIFTTHKTDKKKNMRREDEDISVVVGLFYNPLPRHLPAATTMTSSPSRVPVSFVTYMYGLERHSRQCIGGLTL